MSDNSSISVNSNHLTEISPDSVASSHGNGKALSISGSRVKEVALDAFPLEEATPAASKLRASSEIGTRFREIATEDEVEIVKTDDSRRATLEKRYDDEIKNQPKVPSKLLTKEEWVEMRLGFEKKFHRVKQAAAIIWKGFVAMKKDGFKGATLYESYKLEAILPGHPMGDSTRALYSEWGASADTRSFSDWLHAEHPEVVAVSGVAYFSEEDRRFTALTPNENGVFMNNDTPYSTANERVGNGSDRNTRQLKYKEGVAMYVMGPDQTLYATSQIVNEKHHSSFMAGGAVIGAGECKVVDGKLTMISNKSGHYKPSKENMLDVLRVLHKQKVPLTDVRLELTLPDNSKHIYKSALEFLETEGKCLPQKMIDHTDVISFREIVAADGSVERSISFVLNSTINRTSSLQQCIDAGWNLSQVSMRIKKRLADHSFIYHNASNYLKSNGGCLPNAIIDGSKQHMEITTQEYNEQQVKKLTFSASTTPDQVREMIIALENEKIDVSDPDIQIGENTEVKLSVYLPEFAPRVEENLLQNEVEITPLDLNFEEDTDATMRDYSAQVEDY
ncbi:MAG: hypothetical protein ACHQUC_01155 [Chlamydiales bacterium]